VVRSQLPLEIRGIRASVREPMAAAGSWPRQQAVIGLITWPRIDDQQRRSLLTRRPRAAFTAGQPVTERGWPGWPGRRRFHAEPNLARRRSGACPVVRNRRMSVMCPCCNSCCAWYPVALNFEPGLWCYLDLSISCYRRGSARSYSSAAVTSACWMLCVPGRQR